MNNKILSVVIPTYNMEQWLGRCLDSLVFCEHLDKIEVLVVNDGSKDRSLEIAGEYGQRFPNSVKVIDKPNGNYGSCVNKGLELATGKYFRILDADDWVDTDGLCTMIEKLEKIETDLVFTHFTSEFLSDGSSLKSKLSTTRFEEVISSFSPILEEIDIWNDLTMHKMTYRTELLRSINFHQTEGISYTDIEYVYYPIEYIKSICFLDLFLYKYFVGREGQTISVESRVKNAWHLRKILDRILSVPVNIKDNPFLERWLLEILVFDFSTYYHNMLILQPKNKNNTLLIRSFDDHVKQFNLKIYERLNNISTFGIKYISIWRKYKIRIMSLTTYNLYQRIKKYIAPKNIR